MKSFRRTLAPVLLFLLAVAASAAEKPMPPIRALLVTGGCCHDYDRQKLILARGISARAPVEWTVVQQGGKTTNAKIPLYEDKDWAKGFDVVVHNECFAAVNDKEWVETILKPHREGTAAVLIHCAMHCYRTGDDKWFEFVGVQSPGHGAHYGHKIEITDKDHPITQGLAHWATEKGELYHTIKVFPDAHPIATAQRRDTGEPQVCVWTNKYGKGNVFATTIGHHNETMADPAYLDMVTRGLLWSVGRLDDFQKADEATDAEIMKLVNIPVDNAQGGSASQIPSKCCGDGNLLTGKKATASSEESNKNNMIPHALDGDLRTRWCASGARSDEWWQVDLGEPQHVRSVRIHWEAKNAAYKYKVDASADGEKWKTIVDQTDNKKVNGVEGHQVDSPETKFLRITYFGSNTGAWASIREAEAYAGDLPKLPEGLSAAGEPPATTGDVQVVLAKDDDSENPTTFDVTMFGTPPEVNYPVCLTAAPTGEVFVGVDEQGSLGKKPGGGKVLRCMDTDGDGKADKINVFAEMDHPRGLIYDNGSLWVLHPPTLSVYHDDDLDGVADRSETLITGISTDQVDKRGADHTTNGIRMGIDGWIYIAVGDFGFTQAKGTDGTTLARRGGGVVRVRPDGTEMEIYSWGQRNILDVGIDPYLNMFTRDNTNDGGGWDIRVTHVMQSADYGYPSKYINFAEETMPPLADYGGGSGCGAMYLHDARWPAPYGDAFYSCDWGTSQVYRHNLPAEGPSFKAHQETFLKIPRPTDIDIDGRGLMYVSSWKGGSFNFSGPNVGFVAQVKPTNFVPKPFPDLAAASDAELVQYLAAESAVYRMHSQRELLRRGAERSQLLVKLASHADAPLYGRVAAIFTLKQLDGANANEALLTLAKDDVVREWALRALTDRKPQIDSLLMKPFVAALQDENPRVQAQAVISLGRIGNIEAAKDVLALTKRNEQWPMPTAQPLHKQPDVGRVIPHLAMQSLVAMNAVDACLEALDGPYRQGALLALRNMHDERVVSGLAKKLSTTQDGELRKEIFSVLARLYHREGDYTGGWWGTRPDNVGPYFDRKTWEASEQIAALLKSAASSDKATAELIGKELARHKVSIKGLADPASIAANQSQQAIAIGAVDPTNKNLIGNMGFEDVLLRATETKGDAAKGKELFTQQSCIKCHTAANGETPKGPHLVDIGKRYKRDELIESILKPSAKIAQGFDTYGFITVQGKTLNGFIVSESADAVTLRTEQGLSHTLKLEEIDERFERKLSMMPEGIAGNLTPEQLADLLAYLESLR